MVAGDRVLTRPAILKAVSHACTLLRSALQIEVGKAEKVIS
jgi:hypothetical protein